MARRVPNGIIIPQWLIRGLGFVQQHLKSDKSTDLNVLLTTFWKYFLESKFSILSFLWQVKYTTPLLHFVSTHGCPSCFLAITPMRDSGSVRFIDLAQTQFLPFEFQIYSRLNKNLWPGDEYKCLPLELCEGDEKGSIKMAAHSASWALSKKSITT